MAETQSTTTTTTTEATAPTGDIKVFIDAFNKDFDVEIKKLVDAQQNYKNVYADAIKIATPKQGPWPNDPKVVTIGDLFKYTFPDIESDNVITPDSRGVGEDPKKREDYFGWTNDLRDSKDEKISKMYQTINGGIKSNSKLLDYQNLKKPGITNPSLWSPGQYYFDVFMSRMLSESGPLKDPDDRNGGSSGLGTSFDKESFYSKNGGSASVVNFDPTGEVEYSKRDDGEALDYSNFHDILSSGYTSTRDQIINSTGIDIGGFSESFKYYPASGIPTPPSSFPSLRVQYKSGILSQFLPGKREDWSKNLNFNPYRGSITDSVGKDVDEKVALGDNTDKSLLNFNGNYEHILLYKAFVQAGDNYKSVVLPYESPEAPTTTPDANPPLVKITEPESQFKFNVEKTDTFIIVGGTASSAREFTIVPNNGSEFIVENEIVSYNDEELGEEYSEGEYLGTEEDLFKIEAGEPYPVVDTESLNSLKGFDPENPNESLSTDTSSKYPVSKDKDANIKAIIKSSKTLGVTNKFVVAAILAIVSKESGFIPRSEASYSTTSGARIMKIFGSKGYTAAEWDVIKKDPVRFFDLIYGGKYGNSKTEGYKYRGRGFNQITFKGNYEQYAKETGVDIVGDPDLLNTVDVAAKCVVAYFKRNIKKAPDSIKSRYHFTDINSFSNLNDATGAIYHANAGWGKSYSEIVADSTGGRKKAFDKAGPLYNTYQSQIA